MKKNLRLLLVEDSEDDALLLLRELRHAGFELVSARVDSAIAMAAALEDEVWDVIVSDYRMPQFTGLAALKLMQERGLDLPFILVSGAIGEDIAVQAMKAGAHDYLLKGSLARLAPAVERELRDAEARRQRKRAEAALRESEEQLRLLNQQLESRVIERTSQLRAAVDSLQTEIAERQRLERQILEISECEKARVGQDLHDGLCQTLTGIALTAKLLQHNLEDEKVSLPAASADMKRIVGLIKEAMAEARSLALGMYPVNIEEYGLAHALEKLAEDLAQRYRIKCDFKCDVPFVLADNQVAAHVYRITQEAVSNAYKHGVAESVAIELAAAGGQITLKVEDNGKGVLKELKPTGMGLKTMDYRARAIGGSLEIRQRPRRGLAVICSFPNQQKSEA
jgi:signal transduction histidine kinase